MAESTARDLTAGVPAADVTDGARIAGRVGDDEVVLVGAGGDVFAIGAHCTHYHGPLAEGLVVGETIRCPWHHACFNLRTGAPKAPALDPIPRWRVERRGDALVVREKLTGDASSRAAAPPRASWPESVVIVGGGAAGLAAADQLRRDGYDRAITILSADATPPPDRPNLSKDYLAGKAQPDWIPLRGPEFYEEQKIALLLNAAVASIDGREVRLGDGRSFSYGALLLATGAEPVRLSIPGADAPHVHYLRSQSDSDAIIARASGARTALVIGASFIGLEAAASLRARGISVHVVAPETRPMERVLGPDVGGWVQRLHESQGVVFHLGRQVSRVEQTRAVLSDGSAVEMDMVVVGVGVRPRTDLAAAAGLKIDRGVVVNEYLETSLPNVYAAGDIARWPDARSGALIRVEHWVVAERQGQAVARNMIGARERFADVPFFWSQHYDWPINYVGHAERWDKVEIDGSLDDNDWAASYIDKGKRTALATVGRDRESLEFEAALPSAS